MTKQELIDKIAAIGNLDKKDANRALSSTALAIEAALKETGEVSIPGIGKLTVENKPARKGRNPKTGEAIDIPAKRVPKFSAAKALKDAVNG